MKAIVIVVEGLGAAMVGAYGSATSTTPAIDRLAARSLVLDQCFIDSFDLQRQLRSMWTATHGNCSTTPEWSLWAELAQRNVPARLITDSAVAAAEAEKYGCPQVTLVEVPELEEVADEAEDCALMHVFAAAMEELASPETEGVVWIHSRGLSHVWDAPLELRMAMIDPEDPPPPDQACHPDLSIDDQTDPDTIVGWGQVAAAQVAVLDGAIDAIEQTLSEREDAAEWSWLLTSCGGTPLGEHGRIGKHDQVANQEVVAIPMIVRAHSAAAVGMRRAELCQLPDLPRTLLTSLGCDASPGDSLWGRNLWHFGAPRMSGQWPVEHNVAWMMVDQKIWVRVPAWSLLCDADGKSQLFVKPDDRWEVSDIAARRDDIIDELLALLPAIRQATEASARSSLPSLEANLVCLVR